MKCGSKTPWSNRTEPCGLGCVGDACLYYQVGCYCGCPVCSLAGKDLYATPAALKLAGNCQPIKPTLDPTRERELRTMNIDGLSTAGDWTRFHPWRAPGHTGRGNPRFQPCGVNSGMQVGTGSGNLPPTAKLQRSNLEPLTANGTDLPRLRGKPTVWKAGSVVEAEFALYVNHAGGYSYRLCKADTRGGITEEGCQKVPLEFASDTTEIRYHDGSRPSFQIPATTTDV